MSFISSWGIESRYCCVVSEAGEYLTLVLVQKIADPSTGEKTDQIQNYKLKDGERLIDAKPPTMRPYAGAAGYIYPRWDDDTGGWIECATEDEIAAWEAEHPDPVPLEEKRAAKHAEISAASEAAIKAGMDVETTQGTEHFSLEETDQINLKTATDDVKAGAAFYPYHADGELCRIFTAAEINAIGEASKAHKLYHTTYCNHLFDWIRRADAAELAGITYGAELPEDLAASMQALLTQAGSTTGEV